MKLEKVSKGFRIATLLSALTFVASACDSNPFPDQGKITVDPAPPKKEVPLSFALDLPNIAEAREGERFKLEVPATVPAPGKPVISALELPTGATFDPATQSLVWTPDFEAGNIRGQPRVTYRTYPVLLVLRSDQDRLTSIRKSMTLVVRDVPRKFEVQVDKKKSFLREGEEFKQELKIRSEDFPQGPFQIQVSGLPSGASVTPVRNSTTDFLISFFPGYRLAKKEKNLELDLSVLAFDPRGNLGQQELEWTVENRNAKPLLTGPTEINQGMGAVFTLVSHDPNGEQKPNIKIDSSSKPKLGRFQTEELTLPVIPGQDPVRALQFTIDQVSPEALGKSERLTFESCIDTSWSETPACAVHTVIVNYGEVALPAPHIDRSRWPHTLMKYLKAGDRQEIRVTIRDYQKVEILPEELRTSVNWLSGVLSIQPEKPGIHHFTLVATSKAGLRQAESFVFDALPANRAPTLLLVDQIRSAEVAAWLPALGSVEILNPFFGSGLDERTTALRRSLVLGTDALGLIAADGAISAQVQAAASLIPNLVISTPLQVAAHPFAEELVQVGLKIPGRLKDDSTRPAVDSYRFKPVDPTRLRTPKERMFLQGTLTPESASPAMLELENGTRCKPLFELLHGIADSVIAGVECDRLNGRLIYLGFELGDIKYPETEQELFRDWMKSLGVI